MMSAIPQPTLINDVGERRTANERAMNAMAPPTNCRKDLCAAKCVDIGVDRLLLASGERVKAARRDAAGSSDCAVAST